MSGKAGSIGGIILGVIMAIAAPFTGGSTLAITLMELGAAMTIAGGIAGVMMGSQLTSPEAAKASDMKFGTATEGIPVPVVFGEGAVVQNFMNWEASQFYSKPYSDNSGGKGGDSGAGIAGYNYFLTYEVGICTGEIDELVQVISTPGDILMRGNVYQSVNASIASNGLTASQTGLTVTASDDIFTSDMIGSQIVFTNSATATITDFIDKKNITVDFNQTLEAQFFQLFGVAPPVTFTGSDYAELNLEGNYASKNSKTISEGGMIRIYKGSADQTRIQASDPYISGEAYLYTYINTAGKAQKVTIPLSFGFNYRNICWALFMKYQIGQNVPTPKTYRFIVRRTPKCIRDDGSTVDGLYTRGSNDPTRHEYHQANAASIIYEILTNKLWGRKISSDEIDEASFIYASQYYADKNLGVSFVMDSPDKLVNFMDGIRHHSKTILSWKNGKWTIRCLLDPVTVASTILKLTSNEVEELQVTRPLWPSTVNDLRVEFNNRLKLYKRDSIHVQDSANIDITGRTNSQNIPLVGYTEWNQAAQQAWRVLRESSYPYANCTFYMNRFRSRLEIGDCFRMVWKEWGDQTVTAYFDVSRIESMGKDDDRIKITASESVFFCPVSGEENSIALPVEQVWEKATEIDQGDLYYFGTIFDPNLINPTRIIYPVVAFEAPAIFTNGKKQWTFIIGEVPSADVVDAQVLGGQIVSVNPSKHPNPKLNDAPNQTAEEFITLLGKTIFAPGGFLLTAINDTFKTTNRAPSGAFDFSLQNPTRDETTILGINQVASDGDNLEDLANSMSDWFVMGEEIIQVGYVAKIAHNKYRAFNIIRGCFGSDIVPHPIGQTCFYVQQFAASGYDTKSLAPNTITDFKIYPVSTFGVIQQSETFNISRSNPALDKKYLGLGVLPLSPVPISVSTYSSGALIEIVARPRFYNCGVGTAPIFGAFNDDTNLMEGEIHNLIIGLEGMTFYAITYDANEAIMQKMLIAPSQITFTQDDFSNKIAGTVLINGIPNIPVTIPAISASGKFSMPDAGGNNQTIFENTTITIGTLVFATYNLHGAIPFKAVNGTLNTLNELVKLINKNQNAPGNHNTYKAIAPATIDANGIVSFTVVAIKAGTTGNAIALATTVPTSSWSGATMAGGAASSLSSSVKKVELYAKIGQQSSVRAAEFAIL